MMNLTQYYHTLKFKSIEVAKMLLEKMSVLLLFQLEEAEYFASSGFKDYYAVCIPCKTKIKLYSVI